MSTAADSGPAETEAEFVGSRQRRIFWRRWRTDGDARAAVVLAHGFGEHSGRYAHVAERLTALGYEVYALDHHGHGRSQGPRAQITFADAVADLDQLVALVLQGRPRTPVFLLGHSMGGAIALRYAMAHQDRLRGLILSGPLVLVEGRALSKLIGRMLGAVAPGLPAARIDPELVSRDPEVVEAYTSDPLVHHRPLPAATAAEIMRHANSVPVDIGRITLPTLLLYGTGDRLCPPAGSRMVAERIGAEDLTVRSYEGLYHEILNEPERDRVLDDLVDWLNARTSAAGA